MIFVRFVVQTLPSSPSSIPREHIVRPGLLLRVRLRARSATGGEFGYYGDFGYCGPLAYVEGWSPETVSLAVGMS